jgi:hypothetical protein
VSGLLCAINVDVSPLRPAMGHPGEADRSSGPPKRADGHAHSHITEAITQATSGLARHRTLRHLQASKHSSATTDRRTHPGPDLPHLPLNAPPVTPPASGL